VDLATGVVLAETTLPGPLADLAPAGDHLCARTAERLFVLALADGDLAVRGSVLRTGRINQRLFAGGGLAWSVHTFGYDTFDVSDPAQPRLLTAGETTQFGWRQLVANGSGLGLAAVGPSSSENAQRDLSLYDLSDPQKNDVFLTQFVTPGIARAVALFNGLACVADDTAGLQVVNYLAYDSKGVPPTITIATSAVEGRVAEGASLRVSANARDDVQVRHVEFYVDGVRIASDGNFPFEHRFTTPARTPIKRSLTVRARAVDTGGNFTTSPELTLILGPDVTPPRITTVTPLGGARVVSRVAGYFNEAMNPATLNANSFHLLAAGADGVFDTADDVPVTGQSVAYRAESRGVFLDLAAPLPDGLYRAVVTSAAADLSGNRLGADFGWQFRVADAVFWARRTDGEWNEPINWSTGAVPGPADAVFIESIPGDLLVTHATGTSAIKSLVVGERLTVANSTLQVAGVIELREPLALSNATLKGGTVKQSGAKLLFAANNASTLDGVTVEGDLELTINTRAVIRKGLALAGTVRLDNNGVITFAGDQTFNSGSIVFLGTSGALEIASGTTLTLGPAMVVRGNAGVIGGGAIGSRQLINQGLISADVAGGTLTISPPAFENTGVLRGDNGGTLRIISAQFTNTGTIEELNGGKVLINP
jgi:hypothetical protein